MLVSTFTLVYILLFFFFTIKFEILLKRKGQWLYNTKTLTIKISHFSTTLEFFQRIFRKKQKQTSYNNIKLTKLSSWPWRPSLYYCFEFFSIQLFSFSFSKEKNSDTWVSQVVFFLKGEAIWKNDNWLTKQLNTIQKNIIKFSGTKFEFFKNFVILLNITIPSLPLLLSIEPFRRWTVKNSFSNMKIEGNVEKILVDFR